MWCDMQPDRQLSVLWLCFSSWEASDVCIFVGNTATLSMDRAMAWVERLDIFEDVVGDYIISSANT